MIGARWGATRATSDFVGRVAAMRVRIAVVAALLVAALIAPSAVIEG